MIRQLWFYFRTGHATYISLAIQLANFIVIQYVLFLQRFPILSSLGLLQFTLGFMLIYVIVSTLSGFVHAKRQLRVDVGFSAETNPYNFRVLPGKEKEVFVPVTLLTLDFMEDWYRKNGSLTALQQQRIEGLKIRLRKLMYGEEIG